jgi:hypothetical protein
MKNSFSKLSLTAVTVLVVASFAMAPVAEAARAGGGGGGGARASAGGGGGARQSVQPNNSRADAGTRDVRSTSVNNVNVNKNVNVNVDQRGGGGWDHPIAAAVVIGGAIAVTAGAVGSMVSTVPVGCVPVNYGGMVYQQCGSSWYQPQGSEFVVVNPPY